MPIVCHRSRQTTAGWSPAAKTLYTLLTTANEANNQANKQHGDLINFKLRMWYINSEDVHDVWWFSVQSIFDKWLQMAWGTNGHTEKEKVRDKIK